MADTTRADVMSYLEKANMVEISELISEIEEKFGVTAAAPVAAVALVQLLVIHLQKKKMNSM